MTKKNPRKALLWYAVTFVASLFIILFIGTRVTPGTGETSVILTPAGVNHFKK